ncbi:MAG: mannose-1-phosphate guanylyltransferase [Deltaproteobacteria bacterium]|nr:mannose-1-phosphate guanylyltransferase [Deltaproteobacteria bacterium]
MFALILAGGQGTRLWPLSRKKRPKQFLPLVGKKPLLCETVGRLLPLCPRRKIFTIAPVAESVWVRRLLPTLPQKNILIEPAGRNTAPAIGFALWHLVQRFPDEVAVILPADHAIRDAAKFRKILRKGEKFLKRHDGILTLGMKPTSPHTGYGYIQKGVSVNGSIYRVKRFREKPDLKTARKYLKSGDYFWNGGIFIGKIQFFLNEFKKQNPGMLQKLKSKNGYRSLKPVSIDYAIMEKTKRAFVIPAAIGWSDIGSFTELAKWHIDKLYESLFPKTPRARIFWDEAGLR